MRRVYLDMCAIKRPFDNQSQPRVWLETLAITLITQAIQDGQLELVSSSLLEYENSRNPWSLRRDAVDKWLNLAAIFQELTDDIEKRGEVLQNLGVKPIDALHMACAEASGADVFVTCDDNARKHYQGNLNVILPPECASRLQEVDDAD